MISMKTNTKTAQGGRIAAVAGLLSLAGWSAGCATTGGVEARPVAAKEGAASVGAAEPTSGTGEAGVGAGAAAASANVGKGDFYADWYDASAVVLPPPPVGAGERAR